MKTVTFELQIPILDGAPWWIQFLHAVNSAAKKEPGHTYLPRPFGQTLLEQTLNGVDVEVYNEAMIFHTDIRDYLDPHPPHTYTAYIRFEATSVRLRRLFATVAPQFLEAKPGIGLTTFDLDAWYAYHYLKAEGLELQIEVEENEATWGKGREYRIIALTRQLKLAQERKGAIKWAT